MRKHVARFALAGVVAVSFLSPGLVRAQLNPVESRIYGHVRAHQSEALDLLERVVNINSGTLNPDGVREVAKPFAESLQALGFNTHWEDGASFDRAGHLFATRQGMGPHVLLIGHLDTVFEPNSPFQRFIRKSDEVASGPGIIDMKGGNVIIVQALAALHDADVLDSLTVTVALIGDEERAGRPIAVARRSLINAAIAADVAIAFENGDNDIATAVTARRGATKWRLTVAGQAAHSSQVFREDIGHGAIYEAARILDRFRAELSGEPHLTFNPGLILGGTAVDYDSTQSGGHAYGKNNVIAANAVVAGDLRTLSIEQLDRAKSRMRAIVARAPALSAAEIEFSDGYPPMAPSEGNQRLLAVLDRVSRDLGFGAVSAVDPARAGAADVAFTAGHVDMAIDGLGLLGNDEHTESEEADLTTLPIQTARTAMLLYRISRLEFTPSPSH